MREQALLFCMGFFLPADTGSLASGSGSRSCASTQIIEFLAERQYEEGHIMSLGRILCGTMMANMVRGTHLFSVSILILIAAKASSSTKSSSTRSLTATHAWSRASKPATTTSRRQSSTYSLKLSKLMDVPVEPEETAALRICLLQNLWKHTRG